MARHFELGDLDEFAALCADPSVMRFVGDGATLDRSDVAYWIEVCQRKYAERGYGTSAVFELSSGAFAGYCGVIRAPERDFDELVYVFHQRFWGQGYATEIGQAMLDYVFAVSSLDAIAATIDPANDASIRVASKLGMTEQTQPGSTGARPATQYVLTRNEHDARRKWRIVVMGCAGSGKSTLARLLAARLNVPYVTRDELLGLGQGSPEHHDAVDVATSGERWVFDGTPFDVEDVVYPRATLVVFLDYPRPVAAWRALRRAVRVLFTGRADGPHRRESPLNWLERAHPVRWSWSSQPRHRARLRADMESPALAHAQRLHFTRPHDTAAWLRTIEPDAR
jgi:RimJ/RimL family protein N-acetyltransferase/adenylate kinase family enzyme